jgi:hypothetical protein
MPAQHMDRSALLLANGIVYTTWSSHCDASPYTSWVIGYNESNLAQATVLNLVPNGSDGGIWGSGSGPQADGSGNVYVPLGNGTFGNGGSGTGAGAVALNGSGFPANGNYGNAYVKMSSSNGQLSVADYFTMSNSNAESNVDTDLGSGGGMLLPTLNDFNGHPRNLAVAAGKDSNIYIMDTASLGKYNPSADEMYQQLTRVLVNGQSSGVWGSPAWFNGTLYYGAEGNPLRAFQFANGRFGVNSTSQSIQIFSYPGTTPSISANGTSNGIVWAPIGNGTASLHAYDATNLAHELYNTNQATGNRDGFGTGNKFVFPTIVNGKVYVASNGGTGIGTQPGSVAVFGLLASPPTPVSVTPSSGSGSTQTFAFAYTDGAGATDIVSAQMDISATLVSNGACFVYYARSGNQIYLASDTGVFQGPIPLGVAGSLQNSQCTVDGGASSATASGNNLTVSLAVSFKPAYSGAKNIYTKVTSATADGSWVQMGAWTAATAPSPDYGMSMAPGTQTVAGGSNTTYTVTVTPSNGFSGVVSLGVSGLPTGVTGAFNPTTVTGSGTSTLTITAGVSGAAGSYTATVTGTSGLLSHMTSAALTVTGASSGSPSSVSVTPSSGSASSQTFMFAYTDPAGATDIVSTQMDISATLVSNGACFVYYARSANSIYMANDNGVFQGPIPLGVGGVLQNSQCAVDAGASSASASGNNLTVSLAVTFQPAYSGAKKVYTKVTGATVDTSWVQLGTWTVPGSGGSSPSVVSVTPNTGSGSSQTFVFAYTDPAFATDIISAQMDISAGLVSNGACFVYYVRNPSEIFLANDAGVFQGPIPLQVAGTLENSQCTVDAGASIANPSGNNLTVSLAVTFKPAYSGAKNVYTKVSSATVDGSWGQVGTWTVPSSGASSPSAVSVTPNSGSGATQTFAFAYTDPAGATDIVSTQMDISAALVSNGACFVYYARNPGEIYLASDTGVFQGPIPLGVAGTLQNSQCTVDGGASSASASGNNLTVSLAVSFQLAYSGAKNVYTKVSSGTVDGSWGQVGTWTVP